MASEIFEAHRDRMEEDYKLAMENKVACGHCGEIVPADRAMSSVTNGTICFDCMLKQ